MPVWSKTGHGGGIGLSTAERSIRAAASKPNPRPKLPEAEHRKSLKQPTTPTPTGTDFKSAAYEYLDFCKRRYVTKPIRKKPIAINVFRPR